MEGEVLLRSYDCSILSPIGPLKVVFSGKGLVSLGIDKDGNCSSVSGPYDTTDDDRLAAVKTFVTDHFYGRDPGRNDIPLDMEGITPFRKRVYEELMKVPYGDLISYGDLAARAGSPGGARAIGNAMNANPFLLIVPCHRVVRSMGKKRYSLGGFGAGLDAKRLLLRIEGHDGSDISGL